MRCSCVYSEVDSYTSGALMRTNIDIDDKLMAEAIKVSKLPTKRAVVEEALRLLVRLRRQERVLDLFGKIKFADDVVEDRRRKTP
jgi:Arc/MetJ family transcription regulator